MKEMLGDIERWRTERHGVALCRVVGVEGSGPRDPGATMAVSAEGEVAGSISGGCIESAVVEEALEVLSSGRPKLCTFGYSDADAFAVGLTCGGTVHVFIHAVEPSWFEPLRDALVHDVPAALATVIATTDATGLGAQLLVREETASAGLGDEGLDAAVGRDLSAALSLGQSSERHYGLHGEQRDTDVRVFLEAFTPPPRMIIFGATDFTAALARFAKLLGYKVVVCDARATFTTIVRFPMADEVVVEWPHRYLERVADGISERDAICVLTHDPKFDVPAIERALRTHVGYIGAMGSRRSVADRNERLVQAGVAPGDFERVMAPIGLDLGARTPEETAISICAEIIAKRAAVAKPMSLRESTGPIHAVRR